jgi:hypothetical protein
MQHTCFACSQEKEGYTRCHLHRGAGSARRTGNIRRGCRPRAWLGDDISATTLPTAAQASVRGRRRSHSPIRPERALRRQPVVTARPARSGWPTMHDAQRRVRACTMNSEYTNAIAAALSSVAAAGASCQSGACLLRGGPRRPRLSVWSTDGRPSKSAPTGTASPQQRTCRRGNRQV